MKLKDYRQKRDFSITSEPNSSAKKNRSPLIFVIQKHAATRLHYDLRLELNGVLKSWAVPKEPTLDPKIKRLAIHVEDHPYDYKDFAGVIPKGQYGAGTVEIWDQGTYVPLDENKKEISEKHFEKNLKKGELKFYLEGEKLKGEFALIQLKDDPKHWLLIKKNDAFSNALPLTQQAKIDLKKIPKKPLPKTTKPMLCTLVDQPFDDPEWLFEIKWDGYRALAFLDKTDVQLYSRSLQNFNALYPVLVKALAKLQLEAVLDGEIVVVDADGKPSFQDLQNYQNDPEHHLMYYVFDLLSYKGRDLRQEPLIKRKELLKQILPDNPYIRFSDHVLEKGISFFKQLRQKKLEGMIAKRMDSQYLQRRSRQWLKIKTHQRQEAIICGFTAPRGGRKNFGALILGVYENKELIYVGHTGTGFDQKSLKMIYDLLTPLIAPKSPFKEKIKPNTPVTWVLPKLVCEIAFSEWTKEGHLRHPVFMGMRIDKKAKQVGKELPEVIDEN